jgi:hypothetical protein
VNGPADLLPVPRLETLEAERDAILAELNAELERVRDEYRLIQDAEVEVEAGGDVGRLWSRMYTARKNLVACQRRMRLAQAALIPPDDPRAAAARQTTRYLNELAA